MEGLKIGDRQFVMKLEALIKDRPYDIENLQLSIPTLKGLMHQAPAHMSLEVISTEQRDVHPVMGDLKKLVADCGLVWLEQP